MPNEITGRITSIPGIRRWGDTISIDVIVNGQLGRRDQVYATVVATQDSNVVYQYSDVQLGDGATFPLVQQPGLAALGVYIDTAKQANAVAVLELREPKGKGFVITSLGSPVSFLIDPGPT